MSSRVTAWAWAACALALVMAVDQITKQMALRSLVPGDPVNVFFGIDLTLVRNRGIAFGVLSDGGPAVTFLTLGALALLLVYFARSAARPGLWLPIGTILGGALGNLADRARSGAVIDFIDPVAWPSFNVADSAIVLGVLGLLYVVEGPGAGASPVERPAAER